MRKLILVIAAVALIGLPWLARATLSDSINVYADPAGTQWKAGITVTEGDEIQSPNNLWQLDSGIANSGIWNTLAGAPTLVLEGPNIEGAPGTISDIVGIARLSDGAGGWVYKLAFISDPDPAAWPIARIQDTFGYSYSAYPTVTEPAEGPGIYVDIKQYVDWPNYNSENGGIVGKAVFFSDVPEPTTMIAGALLLLPFGASTLRMLRRRAA